MACGLGRLVDITCVQLASQAKESEDQLETLLNKQVSWNGSNHGW